MREVFIAVIMLSMPVALVLVLGKTALHIVDAGASPVAREGETARAGDAVWLAQCASCHGREAEVGALGPQLVAERGPAIAPRREVVHAAVTRGSPAPTGDYGPKPAMHGISEAEITAVAGYLQTLARERHAGG